MIIKNWSVSNMVTVDSGNLHEEKLSSFFLSLLSFHINLHFPQIFGLWHVLSHKSISLNYCAIKSFVCYPLGSIFAHSALGFWSTNIIYKQSSWPAQLWKQVQRSLWPVHPETAPVACRTQWCSQLACLTLPAIRSPACQLESTLLEPNF